MLSQGLRFESAEEFLQLLILILMEQNETHNTNSNIYPSEARRVTESQWLGASTEIEMSTLMSNKPVISERLLECYGISAIRSRLTI